MKVTQLSIFLENRAGRLAAVTRLLASKQINILALSLADTSDFGILRLIANRPDEAAELLAAEGFTVKETEVLAVEAENRPGALAAVLDVLAASDISVEYMYAFAGRGDVAAFVFRFEDPEAAITALSGAGIDVLSPTSVLNGLSPAE